MNELYFPLFLLEMFLLYLCFLFYCYMLSFYCLKCERLHIGEKDQNVLTGRVEKDDCLSLGTVENLGVLETNEHILGIYDKQFMN